MEQNKKIWVSDEIADFIKSHNTIGHYSSKYKTQITMRWNECKYIDTEDPNVFEVIFPDEFLDEFLENRRIIKDYETKDNS